jgi:acyl-CoA thioesterase-1
MRLQTNTLILLLVLGCAREKAAPDADAPNPQATTADTAASALGPGTNPAPAQQRTILFVGTSLTAGYGLEPDSAYPQQIQRMIDSAGFAYQVVNAGVSGETSSGLLRRLDWLLRQPFDIVVIETGANDGLRGIPVETMQQNIQQIIERVRAARPSARIALIQMEALPNLGRSYTQRFRDVFPEVAKRNSVVLLPFLLDGVAGRRELNQPDGIHPDYAGERIVTQNVWRALRPLLQ